jgi:hypothetical protein
VSRSYYWDAFVAGVSLYLLMAQVVGEKIAYHLGRVFGWER